MPPRGNSLRVPKGYHLSRCLYRTRGFFLSVFYEVFFNFENCVGLVDRVFEIFSGCNN